MVNNIRIVFYCERRFFISRFILWVTGLWASHVALTYWDEDWKRRMVMEATVGGFRIVPFDKFEKHSKVVAVIEPKYSLEKGLADAVDYLGTDFDYVGLFGMAWVAIGRWFKKKWKNPLASSNALFCSEIITLICKWSNYPGVLSFREDSTEPMDLYEFFLKEQKA